MTIIAAVTTTGAEPPKLDRYRNEIAASLLGIKPNKANTEGLLSLRKLAASAPDPDGDVVFLTPPRAINVVKACQGWVIAPDDDDDDGEEVGEQVENEMLSIFMHLAPILQNVPGGHWEFMFDVLEGVLERASADKALEEAGEIDEDLVALARALRLVLVLEDLVTRNKSLMAEWEERRMSVLVIIRDLSVLGLGMLILIFFVTLFEHCAFSISDSADVSFAPRSACRELVLSVLQHLPSSLIDQDTLPKVRIHWISCCISLTYLLQMCHLIQDPAPTVQKKAYQLLQIAAKKRTEYFVIEAAVDTEGVVQAELPIELIAIVQSVQFGFGFGLNEGMAEEERGGEGEEATRDEDQDYHLFGYLLAWMLVFDLFQDAVGQLFCFFIIEIHLALQSFKVKSNYIEQLKNHNVVAGHLIPCFLSLLRLDQGSSVKAFKLDVWGVDDFYIDCQLFCVHLLFVSLYPFTLLQYTNLGVHIPSLS